MKIELLMKDIHDCEAKRYMIKVFERMHIDEATGNESACQHKQNADVSTTRGQSDNADACGENQI